MVIGCIWGCLWRQRSYFSWFRKWKLDNCLCWLINPKDKMLILTFKTDFFCKGAKLGLVIQHLQRELSPILECTAYKPHCPDFCCNTKNPLGCILIAVMSSKCTFKLLIIGESREKDWNRKISYYPHLLKSHGKAAAIAVRWLVIKAPLLLCREVWRCYFPVHRSTENPSKGDRANA